MVVQNSVSTAKTSTAGQTPFDKKNSAFAKTQIKDDIVAVQTPETTNDSKSGDDNSNDDALYENIPADEVEILKGQITTASKRTGYFQLFRYANTREKWLLAFAASLSIIAGACLPLFTIIMGGCANEFNNFFTGETTRDDFRTQINYYSRFFIYLFLGQMVTNTLSTYIHIYCGEVLTARIRARYFDSLLNQNVAYFDKRGAGEVTTFISTNTNLIQEGVSEKIAVVISSFAALVTGIVISFIKFWKLALILLSLPVFVMVGMAVFMVGLVKHTNKALKHNADAANISEEAFSAIRTVCSFNLKDQLVEKYSEFLVESFKEGILKARAFGGVIGIMWFTSYTAMALTFYMGSRFVKGGETNVGNVITILFAMLIATMNLAGIAPNFQSITNATAAAQKIFEAIDRVPFINSRSEEGNTLENVTGTISFKHVKLSYPSRPNVQILKDFSLHIEPGKSVALVGPSGSGKSSIVNLLERFYAPTGGEILLDGNDISSFNLQWLRHQIGLVEQEPVLFTGSVFENVCLGLIGTPFESSPDSVKLSMVEQACKDSNAWAFIEQMPKGIYSEVGPRGSLLSGGQKQRIAIARAIVKQPKILLLDEATSALDNKSEDLVQQALDRASKNRTTITIAHRLSTIRNADLIVVMSKGEIVEQGSHAELIELDGLYADVVKVQTLSPANDNHLENMNEKTTSADPGMIDKHASKPLERTSSKPESLDEKFDSPSWDSDSIESGTSAEPGLRQLVKMLYSQCKSSRIHLYLGIVCAVAGATGYPIASYFVGNTVNAFMVPEDQYGQMRADVNKWSGLLFMLAVVVFTIFGTQIALMGYASEDLVRGLKKNLFDHFLSQDIEFFDEAGHSSGSLVSILSSDSQHVLGFGGNAFGQAIVALCTVIGGIIVAVVVSWRLGLVTTSVVPVIIFCGYLRYAVLTRIQAFSKKAYESSAAHACESARAIRTVTALTCQSQLVGEYEDKVQEQVKNSQRFNAISAGLYSLSLALVPLIMALAFWHGGRLMSNYQLNSYEFFVAYMACIAGAQSAGNIFGSAPDMGKAKQASIDITKLFRRQPKIVSSPGLSPLTSINGDISFENVTFSYPSQRGESKSNIVLQNFNLSVKSGQYVAFVGPSGCGKSTAISLIERFYVPSSGQIKLDGKDIAELDLQSYRSHMALVQQEPILFSGTIRENISYGCSEADETQIENAAKQANIHDFIMSLPDGYDTPCGSKASLISGGQKQRIAIARALVRNPKILLLDEATSALDSESEHLVQAALDEASAGRTTISVAHRLSTVCNADCIFVFNEGAIVESGTHDELCALKGLYYGMFRKQALEN